MPATRRMNALLTIATAISILAPVGMTAQASESEIAQRLLDRQAKLEREIAELKQQLHQVLKAKPSVAEKAAAAQKPAETPATGGRPASSVYAINSQIDFPDKFRIVDNDATTLGVYGTVEATLNSNSTGGPYAHQNTELPGGGVINRRWTGLDKPWLSANRWGINASHVLDKDTGTILLARLESEFELPTGNMDTPGTLFNRDAWVGIASPTIGKLTAGRQDTLARDVNMIWANPSPSARAGYSEGGWYDNDVIVTPKTYFESATGSRADAELMWKKAWNENWVSYLAYQTAGLRNSGSGSITDVVETGSIKEQEFAGGFGYNSSDDKFHISGSYTYASINDKRKSVYAIGGNVLPASWLRLNGGYIGADIAQPSGIGDRHDDTFAASVQVNPGAKIEYVLGYNYTRAHNAGVDGDGNTLAPFDPTDTAAAAASGTLGTAYALIYYRWDPNTTFYVAADYSGQGGGYVNGNFNGHNSMNQVGGGVRYNF